MKLTNKELIRLKKEVFLVEHGFYDIEIANWFDEDFPANRKRIRDILGDDSVHYYSKEWKQPLAWLWLKEHFPEFFEEESKQ